MRNKTKKAVKYVFLLPFFVFFLQASLPLPLKAAPENTEEIYLAAQQNVLSLMDSEEEAVYGNEWLALDLLRDGKEIPASYQQSLVDMIVTNEGILHSYAGDYTNYAKAVLVLSALGIDARDVAGYDLIEAVSDFPTVKEQGVNGIIYALMALDCKNYEVEPPASLTGEVTRETYIDAILSSQLGDGGWDWMDKQADPDMTAMAIQALAPYYDSNENVKAAVDTALQTLSDLQQPDGGFRTEDAQFEESAESTAMVILALTALGIDPASDPRFIKDGNTTIDNLCMFAVPDGGFKHTKDGNYDSLATDQGYRALISHVRQKDGKTSFYDMSDVPELKPASDTSKDESISEDTEQITNKPGPVLWIILAVIVIAVGVLISILIHKRKRNKGDKQ